MIHRAVTLKWRIISLTKFLSGFIWTVRNEERQITEESFLVQRPSEEMGIVTSIKPWPLKGPWQGKASWQKDKHDGEVKYGTCWGCLWGSTLRNFLNYRRILCVKLPLWQHGWSMCSNNVKRTIVVYNDGVMEPKFYRFYKFIKNLIHIFAHIYTHKPSALCSYLLLSN